VDCFVCLKWTLPPGLFAFQRGVDFPELVPAESKENSSLAGDSRAFVRQAQVGEGKLAASRYLTALRRFGRTAGMNSSEGPQSGLDDQAAGEGAAAGQRRTSPAFLLLICALLSVVTLAIYFQTHSYRFVTFDDNDYVYSNPWVQRGLSVDGIAWALTALYINWHPLAWLSLMLDVQLFGLNPGPQHLINVAFHIASTVLLLLALTRLTGKPARCAFVAAIFAVHPLHVESVAWIAERKDVLSTFFEMVTLLLYAGYAQKQTALRYASVAVAFACSLMAKPTGVTFPFVLLLVDYWPLDRLRLSSPRAQLGRLVWEKAPLLAMSAVASVLTVMAQRRSGAVISLARAPFTGRLANAAIACVGYIEKAIWPTKLGVFYPLQPASIRNALTSLLILVIITGIAVYWLRRRPYVLVGWLWYLGMLIPVIGLVQVGEQSMADRYTYLPLVGLSMALVWLVSDAVAGRFLCQVLSGTLASAALLILAVMAYRQTSYWRDSETLYDHTLAVTTGNYLMENNLGVIMSMEGRHFEAMNHYEKAIAIRTDYEGAHENLGAELLDHGRVDEAFIQLTEAIRLDPDRAVVRANLGTVYKLRGDFQEARRLLVQSLIHMPGNAFAHSDLCFVLAKIGSLDEAIAHCREALRINPNLAEARFNLASGLATQGNTKAAADEYSQLLTTHPSYPGARAALEKLH
jgi:Flp pilus assembly protein TadD